jgi:hypothetical protein
LYIISNFSFLFCSNEHYALIFKIIFNSEVSFCYKKLADIFYFFNYFFLNNLVDFISYFQLFG